MDTLLQILYISSFKKVEEQIKMKRMKILTKSILFIIILSICICMVTQILKPQIPAFYKEKHYDAVFFGTSQSYCSFDPEIFDEYELKTYNRGRQQQTMNYTYYYVKDALDNSDIDVVVLEIFGMFYDEDDTGFTSEGVRDSSLNDLRYSDIKVDAIKDCVPEDLQLDYLFPLGKYHSRWEELDYSSFEGWKESVMNPYFTEEGRGFKHWAGAQPCGYASWDEIFSEKRRPVYEENFRYLDMMNELSKEHGTELVLVRAPFPCNEKTVEMTNTVMDWADTHEVELINCMKVTDVIGLNFEEDSLDAGTHLNESGGKKVSRYIAEYLKENVLK